MEDPTDAKSTPHQQIYATWSAQNVGDQYLEGVPSATAYRLHLSLKKRQQYYAPIS
jgi:hypothetical protein